MCPKLDNLSPILMCDRALWVLRPIRAAGVETPRRPGCSCGQTGVRCYQTVTRRSPKATVGALPTNCFPLKRVSGCGGSPPTWDRWHREVSTQVPPKLVDFSS